MHNLQSGKSVNYYEILKVPENATKKEIQLAHIKLLKEYHPDLNKNKNLSQDELTNLIKNYELIKEAGNILINDKLKNIYDSNKNKNIDDDIISNNFISHKNEFQKFIKQQEEIKSNSSIEKIKEQFENDLRTKYNTPNNSVLTEEELNQLVYDYSVNRSVEDIELTNINRHKMTNDEFNSYFLKNFKKDQSLEDEYKIDPFSGFDNFDSLVTSSSNLNIIPNNDLNSKSQKNIKN
jgi:DnaJ-class molecular chaperone